MEDGSLGACARRQRRMQPRSASSSVCPRSKHPCVVRPSTTLTKSMPVRLYSHTNHPINPRLDLLVLQPSLRLTHLPNRFRKAPTKTTNRIIRPNQPAFDLDLLPLAQPHCPPISQPTRQNRQTHSTKTSRSTVVVQIRSVRTLSTRLIDCKIPGRWAVQFHTVLLEADEEVVVVFLVGCF